MHEISDVLPLKQREVPPEIQNMVVDVANAFAQIINEVMHFASEQPDGGPGGHTVAVICMAASEMMVQVLLIYEVTRKATSVTANKIENKPLVPN